MKEYIDNLVFRGVLLVGFGIVLLYQGFTPYPTSLPIVTVLLGIFGIAGVGAVLFGLYSMVKAISDICRHLKQSRKG